MKKTLLLSLLSCLFMVTGCSQTPATQVNENPYIVTSPWGKEVAQACYDQLRAIPPYLTCEEVEYEKSVDDYGDSMITLYLYFIDDESLDKAFDEYGKLCASYGYTVEVSTQTYMDENYVIYQFEAGFADLIIYEHVGLEIEYIASMRNNKPCLGLFVFTYVYSPKDSYPQVAVDKLLGEEKGKLLPQIIPNEDEEFEYDFSFFLDENNDKDVCLEIVISGCSYEMEETYFDLMEDITPFYQLVCNDYYETYEEVTTGIYPGYDFGEGNYYLAFLDDNIGVIYWFDLSNYVFVIDIFPHF